MRIVGRILVIAAGVSMLLALVFSWLTLVMLVSLSGEWWALAALPLAYGTWALWQSARFALSALWEHTGRL